MTEQDPFNKRHEEEVTPSQRKLLDELNLPPRFRSFLEKNGNYIKAGLLVILILVPAWVFYDYYTAKQKEQASALLFQAVNQRNPSASQQMMDKLRQEYSSTGAALWSRITTAQRQMDAGNYSEAIKQYNAVLNKVGQSSPLSPLLEYGLAIAYESSGQYNEAVEHFKTLQDKTGFASIAYFGLACNQEVLGRIAEARKNYEKAKTGEGAPDSVRQYIDHKLSTI